MFNSSALTKEQFEGMVLSKGKERFSTMEITFSSKKSGLVFADFVSLTGEKKGAYFCGRTPEGVFLAEYGRVVRRVPPTINWEGMGDPLVTEGTVPMTWEIGVWTTDSSSPAQYRLQGSGSTASSRRSADLCVWVYRGPDHAFLMGKIPDMENVEVLYVRGTYGSFAGVNTLARYRARKADWAVFLGENSPAEMFPSKLTPSDLADLWEVRYWVARALGKQLPISCL